MLHRRLALLTLVSLAVSACSGTPAPVEVTAGDRAGGDVTEPTAVPAATPIPSVPQTTVTRAVTPPQDGHFADTVSRYCARNGDDTVEMRFRATVTHIDVSGPAPWTTFTVSEWFTEDVGTQVGLWSPGFNGQVGEDWLVASSRYAVGLLSSGDVFWCDSEPFSASVYDDWTSRYGATVVAGTGRAETPMSASAAAELARNEARWQEHKPSAYTYTVSVSHVSGARPGGLPQPGVGQFRVVVENDAVVQAESVADGRRWIAPEGFPTIESLFELVRLGGGATDMPPEYSPEFGFVRQLSAADRSVQVSVHVSSFEVGAFPLSEDPLLELEAKRAMWASRGPKSYSWELDTRCFCAYVGPVPLTVIAGQTDPDQEGIQTVEELFDAIVKGSDADALQVAYHPQLGYPMEVRVDHFFNASDDEISYFVADLTPIGG